MYMNVYLVARVEERLSDVVERAVPADGDEHLCERVNLVAQTLRVHLRDGLHEALVALRRTQAQELGPTWHAISK